MKRIIFILLSFLSHTLFAQSSLPFEFGTPKKIPALSSEEEEVQPVSSADGTQLYFVRTFATNSRGDQVLGHTIWHADKDSTGEWTNIRKAKDPLNEYTNNSVIRLTNKDTKMYLFNVGTDRKGQMKATASVSNKSGNYWAEPMPFNLPTLNSKATRCNIHLSADEKVMIISMDGGNAIGMEDLYVSTYKSGIWSAPQNLGNTINTAGFETSPFLTSDGEYLFFASNGHSGFGDADIFVSKRLNENYTAWSEPINLGETINSKGFDAYFYINEVGEAFFASNKNERFSDIYTMKVNYKIEKVKEEVIDTALAIVPTQIIPQSPQKSSVRPTAKNTVTDKTTPKNNQNTTTPSLTNKQTLAKPTAIKPDIKKDTLTIDHNTLIKNEYPLQTIYFQTASYAIDKEYLDFLDEVISFLKLFPNIKVMLGGHTDTRGNAYANQILSEKRTQAVKTYLIDRGVKNSRIKTESFGFSKPLEPEEKGKGSAKNRRVEILFYE